MHQREQILPKLSGLSQPWFVHCSHSNQTRLYFINKVFQQMQYWPVKLIIWILLYEHTVCTDLFSLTEVLTQRCLTCFWGHHNTTIAKNNPKTALFINPTMTRLSVNAHTEYILFCNDDLLHFFTSVCHFSFVSLWISVYVPWKAFHAWVKCICLSSAGLHCVFLVVASGVEVWP